MAMLRVHLMRNWFGDSDPAMQSRAMVHSVVGAKANLADMIHVDQLLHI